VAQEKITQAELSDRITTRVGDFFSEALPRGSDVLLLSMILHDWAPEKNAMILRKCFDALPSRGALIVSELMMDDDKTGPIPAAMMSMIMLIETEGRNYTWAEYTEWLEETGFQEIQRTPLKSPGANGILVGHKP
ncbi:MAG TPA: methyltransferase, partial [bacterium]|nr:methyltransferase [bacterium]